MSLIHDGEIDVLTGEDPLILTTLCLGGTGAISAAAHLHPERFVALVEQVAQGDLAAARSNFYTLLPMIQQMFSYPNPGPVKAALSQQGLIKTSFAPQCKPRHRYCNSKSPIYWRRCQHSLWRSNKILLAKPL